MKINTEASHFHPSQSVQTSAVASADAASFSSALAAAAGEMAPAPVRQADFTSMTRQEMFDWMNDQIRSGKMSLDESSPFLGMTMKISAATGQPVDMATDSTRIDFMAKARLGVEGARSRNDQDLVKKLQFAMEVMSRQQRLVAAG